MKRKLTILSVLAAVYLVVSVAPVSAAHVAMVSSHTTASELSNGSLSNSEVIRSGEAGAVEHDTARSSAVFRYAFDSGSGSTAYDHVGSADGAISEGEWVEGISGQGLRMDSRDEVSGPSLSHSGDLFVSAWVKPDTDKSSYIVNNYGGVGSDEHFILGTGVQGADSVSQIQFYVDDGNTDTVVSGPNITTGSWYHLAGGYDADTNTLQLYVNGELVATKEHSGADPDWTQRSVDIGESYTGGSGFSGIVDEVRVHNQVPSPGLVDRLNRYPSGKLTPTATHRYGIENGSGSTIYGDEGATGTIKNNVSWVQNGNNEGLQFPKGEGRVDLSGFSSSSNTHTFVYQLSYNGSSGYLYDTNSPQRFILAVGEGTSDSESLSYYDGSWHDLGIDLSTTGTQTIAIRFDASDGTVTAFKNGNAGPTQSYEGNIEFTDGTLGARYSTDSYDYRGTMYEFRHYEESLSQDSIQQISEHPAAQAPETSTYTSTDHAVTNSVKGFTDLELRNATATVTWRTADGSVLNQTTLSSSGNHTLTWPTSDADNVEVDVAFDPTHPDHTARLEGEGIYAQTNAPSVDDSSLSPNSTSSTVGSLPVTLSASVSDPDFSTSQGDSATVEWYVDGSKRGETTVSSNGTVSHELDSVDSGTHDWHVEISDDDGHTDTSATASFAMPGELKIYNESAPNSLVDSATVNIQFYGGQDGDAFTVQRSTTDGTIDMSGLPADQEFIVVVNSEGYHNRRIYLESLTEQANVYLLPTSEQAVYNVFRIDDKSGSYPPGETRIIIQRALNKSGNFTWQTVSGDFFGSTNEHKTNLRYNVRYRLIVENDEGQRRMIGPYFATDENNPKVITVSSIVVSPPEGQAYYGTSYIEDETEDDGQKTLRFTYTDPEELTDSLDVVIHERGNESNVLADVSTDDVGTEWTYSTVLDENESAKSWVVDWKGQRDGEEIGAAVPVGNRGGLPLPMGQEWLTRFGLVALVVVASLSSERMATIGAMGTVAFAGILMITGIWEIPVVLWFAALIIAVGGHALTKAQRGGVVG